MENLPVLRRKSWFKSGTLCGALACLIAACAETSPPEENVALVGKEAISKSEVEEFAASLLPGLRSKKSGRAARLDYLQTLIDEKLLVREASARGLDTTRSLIAELAKAFRDKVIDDYSNRHLEPGIDISEEEVRERFVKEGFNRERALQRLSVQTTEEATQLREQLEQGADFAELAKAHSLDPKASEGGREVFVSRYWAARLHIPPQVFDDLQPGEISQPLPVRGGYQLIRFTDEREGDFTRYRQMVYGSIAKEKRAIQYRALVEELAYKFGLYMQKDGLDILANKPLGRRMFPQLSPQEATTPLYVYEQGKITVGDYIDACRETGVRPGLADSLEVARVAWQRAIPGFMIWEDARQKGYHETASAVKWKERNKVERLIKALRRTAVAKQLVITDEMAQEFYRDNPSLFAAPTELYLQEILVDDLDEATELRRRLDSGEDMAALVHLTQRPGAVDIDGKLHLHSYEEVIYGNLVREGLKAETGQLVGPVKTEGGYSVFRLVEKVGGQLHPFEEVERRVKATLRFHKEEPLFTALVSAIREKYADQVRIFEEVLSEVQLPEENTSSPDEDANPT